MGKRICKCNIAGGIFLPSGEISWLFFRNRTVQEQNNEPPFLRLPQRRGRIFVAFAEFAECHTNVLDASAEQGYNIDTQIDGIISTWRSPQLLSGSFLTCPDQV